MAEAVEFRGARRFVAEAEWDQSSLGVGSHWHLTLTGPLCDISTCFEQATAEAPPVRYCAKHNKKIVQGQPRITARNGGYGDSP